MLFANVREEERSLIRNINYETNLWGAGAFAEYNFDHFLPDNRKITPYVTAGFEVIEFNTKADLKAMNGEPYNYWSDGTIRSLPEASENADDAVIVRRDYNYETDIRDAGINNSNSYAENAFLMPVGLGITMHLTDQFDFRFESVMHLSWSDYIDGYTRNTDKDIIGKRNANANNDHFLTSGFALSYTFQKVDPAEPLERLDDMDQPFDFLATGNTEDFDQDGVIDLIDKCPNTPANIEVDTLGCPIDTDGDGIPDYKDEEINSEYPEFANDKGVELTDEMIYASYLRYIDSTYELAEVVERQFGGGFKKKAPPKYRVQVGEFTSGNEPEDMSSLLNLNDLSKLEQDDKVLYTVGEYMALDAARSREKELLREGFEDVVIVERNRRGAYRPISPDFDEAAATDHAPPQEIDLNKVVFRVQLGAFKTKPSTAKYNEIPQLMVVESGGYYRYMSGAFDTFEEAAKHKVKMSVAGYKDAFVVAFKGGQKVSLKSVGVNPISSDPIIGK